MIKKRIIGIVTVLNGWAVQSISYKRYLPLGKPSVIAKNLENWGADEIFINSIDRSKNNKGPDFKLLEIISKLSLSTPLIYGGGIKSVRDAEECIKMGSERIVIDSLINKDNSSVKEMAYKLGSQSIIGSIPLSLIRSKLYWFDYLNKKYKNDFSVLHEIASNNLVSEFLLIDKDNEGKKNSFQKKLYELFPVKIKPMILFGGISETEQIKNFFINEKISAIGIANFLNYKEHMIQIYKKKLNLPEIRKPYFNEDII